MKIRRGRGGESRGRRKGRGDRERREEIERGYVLLMSHAVIILETDSLKRIRSTSDFCVSFHMERGERGRGEEEREGAKESQKSQRET